MDDFEDVEDCFDEIGNTCSRQTTDEEFVASGSELPRVNRTGRGSPVTGRRLQKLEDRRWTDHLSRDEERDLIRRARAGDVAAKDRLYRCFNKKLIKIASQDKYGGPPFNEKLSAAGVGFCKAYARYDLSRNDTPRLWSYAAKCVRGAVVDYVHDWHRKGGKGETRAERKDRSKHRSIHVEYNGVEGSHYDLEGREPISAPIAGWIASDDHELRECDGSGGKVTDAAWDRVVAGRAAPTNWPNTKAPEEPCKPISRERYTEDHVQAHRFDTAAHIQQRIADRLGNIGRDLGVPRECFGVDENTWANGGRRDCKSRFPIPRFDGVDDGKRFALYAQGPVLGDRFARPALSSEYLEKYPTPEKHKIDAPTRGNAPALGTIGWLAVESDLRAMRRLAQIGAQKYALELAAKDRAKCVREHGTAIIPLFEPTAKNYSIPVNTHDTAEPPSDSKEAPRPSEHPLVWDQRDQWGGWSRKGRLPDELESKANAHSRMVALTIAVDNGDENGKHDNVIRPSGDLHRTHGGNNRDVRQVRRAAS